MTQQDLADDLRSLVDEVDGVQGKFDSNAQENRSRRINGEPEQRQDTYGDQPEREFNPEVYLLVPHNTVAPGVAAFTRNAFQVVSGDVVTVTLELTNTNLATVVFGGGGKDWKVAMTVVDGTGDGTVAIEMDTGRAGLERHDPTDVFATAASSDTIRTVTRERAPDHLLDEGNYDLTARVGGTETDTAVLEKRRTGTTTSTTTSGGTAETPPQVESRERPLHRRPQAPPPLRSSGVTVRKDGRWTDAVEPGEQYTAEVSVENAGGLGGNVTVELFARHRTPTATIDTAGGVLEGARRDEFRVTGFTSLPPGHTFVGVAYDDPGGTLRADNIIWRSTRGHAQVEMVGETVEDHRTFDIAPYLGDPNTGSFRLRLYWTTGLDLTKDEYYDPTDAKGNYVQALKNDAVQLVDQPGTIVSGGPSNPKVPLDLESTIQESTLVSQARRQVTVPASGSQTVNIDFTAPGRRGDRVLTELHARTYSLAPEDMPADWDALDHTTSRFVGRTELKWVGATAN